MQKRRWVGIMIVACLMLGMAYQPAQAADANDPMEVKLAYLDAGGYVARDDRTVARFRSLLDQLAVMYVEDREQIGEMTFKAQTLLKKEGIHDKMLSILEGMNQVRVTHIPNQRYAEYVAMYVTLRTKYAQLETFAMMQSLMRSLGVQ